MPSLGRNWQPLEDAIAGELVLPGSPGYQTARLPAIAAFHHRRPVAVVLCAAPADVAETISFAQHSGLPAVPRSGGRLAGPSDSPSSGGWPSPTAQRRRTRWR